MPRGDRRTAVRNRWPIQLVQAHAALLLATMFGGVCAARPAPCKYDVEIFEAPAVPGFSSPTFGTGISPNGRYVCGYFIPNAVATNRPFTYDTTTHQLTNLPLPSGYFQAEAWDVADDGTVV